MDELKATTNGEFTVKFKLVEYGKSEDLVPEEDVKELLKDAIEDYLLQEFDSVEITSLNLDVKIESVE